MPLDLETLATFVLDVRGDAGPVRHAANELRAHLPAATPGSHTIRIEAGAASTDGFQATIGASGIVLHGDNPRGALNAAYWLLEQAGILWVEPGPDGVCRRPGTSVPEGTFRETPTFPRRTLILGQDALHDAWHAWLEWASRNRLNDVFFHDTPPSRLDRDGQPRPTAAAAIAADGGGWMFERWDADGPAIRAAAAEHGMTLQFGGHHLPALLPRALFAEHPDWFPERNGERDPRYNLCTSSPGARDHIRTAARAFFERFAGADIYHLWADDTRGGGWCECDACAALSPSDQALIATNLLAGELAAVAPGARVAHLAYHDTNDPPRVTTPAANVCALWAPRSRCYAHAIDDPRCRNHAEFWAPYTGLLARFGNDNSRISVFEYYSDAILFKGLAPTALRVLPADARAYAAGAHNLQDLMVGNRPWEGPPWHAWWMARCAWNPAANPEAELRRFCDSAFPANAAAMTAYYAEQDRAYHLLLDLHDLQPIARHDILDFSDVPRRTLNAKAPEALEGALILAAVARKLDALTATDPAEAARLDRERTQAAAVAALSAHLGHRTSAWDAILDGLRPLAADYLAKATAALETYEAWDAAHVPPAYANISAGMLRSMRYHTARVGKLIEPGAR